jgi:hypothetical protein
LLKKGKYKLRYWKDLNYKERALRLFYPTVILALAILVPDFPVGLYVVGIVAMCVGIAYNFIKHLSYKR